MTCIARSSAVTNSSLPATSASRIASVLCFRSPRSNSLTNGPPRRATFARPEHRITSAPRGQPAPALRTGVIPLNPDKSKRGRPPVHTEAWSKITVIMLDRHVATVDRLAIEIRLKHGKAISRAEILRALVEAAAQSDIDLSDADSVEGITKLLTKRSGGKRKLRQ